MLCRGVRLDVVALLLGDAYHPGGLALTRHLAVTSRTCARDQTVLDVASRPWHHRTVARRVSTGARVDGVDLRGAERLRRPHRGGRPPDSTGRSVFTVGRRRAAAVRRTRRSTPSSASARSAPSPTSRPRPPRSPGCCAPAAGSASPTSPSTPAGCRPNSTRSRLDRLPRRRPAVGDYAEILTHRRTDPHPHRTARRRDGSHDRPDRSSTRPRAHDRTGEGRGTRAGFRPRGRCSPPPGPRSPTVTSGTRC